jgi:hypothetical protein
MLQSNEINSKTSHNIINNQNPKKIHTNNDNLSITIKLARRGDEYHYISDNLKDSSKIKIPLDMSNSSIKHNSHGGIKKERLVLGRSRQQNVTTVFPEEPADYINEEEERESNLIKSQLEKIHATPILIPSCSQWFDLESIHEIEMNSLPEYFCGKYPSKTPEVYKEYRNFIISLYRENPLCYLSSIGKSFVS